jgi:small multidrug resistance family-3 protein
VQAEDYRVAVNYFWFLLAAVLELTGCYAFWVWLRLDRSPWWILPGVVALALFGAALTRLDAQFAGRAYAAYGGIYILASLAWLMVIERTRPLLSDILGIALCVAGATVILFGPRFASA